MTNLAALPGLVLAGAIAAGCGGSPAPGGGDGAGGVQADRPASDASATGQGTEPRGQATAGEQAAAHEPGAAPAGPAGLDTCMEFHEKLAECSATDGAGQLGASAGADLLESAPDSCRAALADRDDPVAAQVFELWARCAGLPCDEIEECFQSGMTRIGAPPVP